MAATNFDEFWTTKPADQVEYTTLEIYNATAGLRRFVTQQAYALDFQLESGAPRNAGEVVTFDPVGFSAPEPEQGEDGMALDINLGAIGFEAKKYLKDVFSAWPPTIEIVWRRYLSGVTEPFVLYFEAQAPALESR